jgi:CyaY protein
MAGLARQAGGCPALSCLAHSAGSVARRCGYPEFSEVAAMSLSEARFHDLVDAVQQAIEDVFDDSGLDVDLENSGGVLTVRFENGSQLIFSRQEPLRQLWLAARSGGFHFDYDEEHGWISDSSGELLSEMLGRLCHEQGGAELEFELD